MVKHADGSFRAHIAAEFPVSTLDRHMRVLAT
jgi:hypothetical protein